MFLSLPALVAGWVFAGIGIYFLGAGMLGYPTTEENTSLAAIWAFVFAFGAVSTAGVMAAKAKFASREYVRQIYMYSIVVTAVLFLGYTVIGMMAALIELISGI